MRKFKTKDMTAFSEQKSPHILSNKIPLSKIQPKQHLKTPTHHSSLSISLYRQLPAKVILLHLRVNYIDMLGASTQQASLKIFGRLLIGVQLLILLFYAIFVRVLPFSFIINSDELVYERYKAFQDTNVMMLIGFGFLMTFIRTHSLSALSYTFFINAIALQVYCLFAGFWDGIYNGFNNKIAIYQGLITASSYCVASILIAFGGVIGRVGPKQLLIMAILQAFFYAFNERFANQTIGIYDAGGSTIIHTFGAYFGLGASWILGKKIRPQSKAEANTNSNTFAMIGTLFLWIYWPSFCFGDAANNNFQQNIIVTNVLLSLTGSCLATFAVCTQISKKLTMQDILNVSLAGGVAIGAVCGICYYPVVGLAIGMIAGVVSTLGFHYLTPLLERHIGLYDTCGINNLHGVPGVLGGIFSAIVMAAYNSGYDTVYTSNFNFFTSPFTNVSNFLKQGGLQLAGTLSCLFFGLTFGLATGFIISLTYNERPATFFHDEPYFDTGDGESAHLQPPISNLTSDDIKQRLIS